MKECDILGGSKHTLTLPTYFQWEGPRPPQLPKNYSPTCIWNWCSYAMQFKLSTLIAVYNVFVLVKIWRQRYPFLPARRSKRGTCYGNVAGWLAGWLSATAGIVSKRLNLS